MKLYEEIGTYEFLVVIKEKFIDDKGQFHTAVSPEQSKQNREAGMRGMNTIETFKPA